MSERAPSTPICLRLPVELAARVDEAAEGNRSAWIKAAIEERLSPASTVRASGRSVSGPAPVSRADQFRRAELLRRAGNSPPG